MKLHAWQAEIRDVNLANGWYEGDRTFGDDVALLHSEVSEALEAYRQWGLDDATSTAVQHVGSMPKPEGFGSEIADVLIRYLDMVERRKGSDYFGGENNGVTLADIPVDPGGVWATSVGDWLAWLHKEIAQGVTTPLWATTVLSAIVTVATQFDVDLPAELERKIAFNRLRGHRHGGKLL